MNVNIEAIRDGLEERLLRGREPFEAVGERQFLSEHERDTGVLSRETCDEIIAVSNEWLAEKTGGDSASARFLATEYARFLHGRVSFTEPKHPVRVLDEPWEAWRRGER